MPEGTVKRHILSMLRLLLRGSAAVLALLLVLLGIAAIRAGRLAAPETTPPPAIPVPSPPADSLALHLSQAVRFGTISLADTGPVPVAALDSMREWMEKTYPRVHKVLHREQVEHSLLYTWQGADASLAPLLLMAHMDVVPVEPGTESKWTHPPYSGAIAEGFVWGRGTMDDKVNVVMELEAIEGMLARGVQPNRTVMLELGHNEEVLGSGARAVAKLLGERKIRPALVIDEGGVLVNGIFPGVTRPVALIGMAEKGYLSLELSVEGAGGHSSTPPWETAVGVLAHALDRVQTHRFDTRFTLPTETMFDALAPHMAFTSRLAIGNRWLLGGVLRSQLAKVPGTNAMIRTTTAPTMLFGSPKDNVLPQKARAVVNFRILPGETRESVEAFITAVVADERVKITRSGSGSDPSPVSDVTSREFDILKRTINEIAPDAIVAPYLLIGGTDSRHFSALSNNVFRFAAQQIGADDIARAHGTNERAAVASLPGIVKFYTRLMESMAVNTR